MKPSVQAKSCRAALSVALGTCLELVGRSDAPLPTRQSAESFRLADPDLMIELVAAEPEVRSPVAIAWDENHRLFVAEMIDYPRSNTGGTIRILEDKDGDGIYEKSSVFADQLPFPNSVLPVKGGVLVTAAPDIWFLKDTDGDGKADVKTRILSGFGRGNQQLRVNGLTWGIDNWIYGANGRSDGEIRSADGQGPWSLRGRDFRFKWDETIRFETLAGRSQFGLGMDAWGNRFLSWNTIPLRHEVFPDRYFARRADNAAADVLSDCLPVGDTGSIFPATPPPLVFNNESGNHFNALSGLHIFGGDALGPEYNGNAFVGESLRNLVHRRALTDKGATFTASRPEAGKEFLSSTDPWFHPVNFATGPDGALYLVDFYRQFVEHPDWVAREMRDRVPWDTGKEHGRIWRVRRKGTHPQLPSSPGLLKGGELVRRLESSNAWQRVTAQRLLMERRETNAISGIHRVLTESRSPVARLHALHLLRGLGALDARTIEMAARDSSPRLRENALLMGAGASQIERLSTDPDSRVRMAAALAAGEIADEKVRERILSAIVRNNDSDPWILRAAASSTSVNNGRWLKFAADSSPERSFRRPTPQPRSADPDRDKVIKTFSAALTMQGSRQEGAKIVTRLCLPCHYIQGHGQRVGPDLSSLASKTPEILLSDILDPSRQVAPDYQTYEIELKSGEPLNGMISSETDTRITLRFSGSPDVSVAKSGIAKMRATGKSLMPEGLENGLTLQDFADLLTFLRQPNGDDLEKGE